MKKWKSSFLVLILLFITFFTGSFATTVNSQNEISLTYQLDFSDQNNLGKNSASSGYADSTVVNNGNIQLLTNEIKGKNAIYLTSAGNRQNYINIPGEVLNNEKVTIAGWFKVSSAIPSWARILEISNGLQGTDSYTNMGIMPYAPNYYNGIHINTVINNKVIFGVNDTDNMLFEGSIPNIERNTPYAGYILPLYDTWVHYAYTLDNSSFKFYQNGKLMKELPGDFTASQFYSDAAKITLGATFHDGTADFTGGFSDVRVYANSLTEEQLVSEYDLSYLDFLTTSYNFENGVADSIRAYDATLVGNAKVEYNEERDSNVLVLDGTNAGTVNETKTSLELPLKTLQGHNELTVSLDILVDSSCGSYARVFEFSPEGRQALSLGAKWGSATSMLLKYTTQNDLTDQKIALETEFNNWVNITVSLDGTQASVYVDGKLIGTNDNFVYKNSLFWEGIGCYAFGRTQFWNDQPLKGAIDNIKIYSKALTEKEVMLENDIISIIDDNEAVKQQHELFNLNWDGKSGTIEMPLFIEEGVKVEYNSDNTDVITNEGLVIFPDEPTIVIITATLTRGEVSMEKEFKFTVNPNDISNPSIINGTELDAVSFVEGSYYEGLMKTNLNYMMSLDKNRLLFNYRRIAGLSTQGATSYGGWISPESNGAGQFESHYIVALAKASQTMPNYQYNGETVLDRLTYMVKELKKCQDAYAAKDPANAGYLGGFSVENFTALEECRNILSDGTSVWVPWYFNHKTLEALLDVYNCAASDELRALAKEMMIDLADWSHYRMSNISNDVRAKVLQREYGGMGEVMFQIYSVTKDIKHYMTAKYFEETSFLDNTYKNVDLLNGLHSNTTIPKFLAAAAAYEVTNNEYYKTICINGFEMIMKRTYANGSTSIGEFWRSDCVTDTGNDTAETCCSYNMIKLADYLYRWTKDVKYADYIENVYTNHILASMAPDTGLKTYLTNTAFGYYKVYHTPDTAFWCCACTGMESFAKLPNGIYYVKDNNVSVNMYYPTTITLEDGLSITQSLDFQASQEALFTISGNKEFTLSLRKPDWSSEVEVYYNGQLLDIEAQDGYFNITQDFKDGDTISYKVPFEARMVNLKGHDNSYAIMYGPTLFVCDLGDENILDQQSSQLNFGVGYTGEIVNKIVLAEEDLASSISMSVVDDNQLIMTVKTLNQGDLIFKPFNQVFHSRYGMYFKYYDSMEELDKEYTVNGNEYVASFDELDNITDDFDVYGSVNSNFKVSNSAILTTADGENKFILKQSLTGEYAIDFTVAPASLNGQINGGIYLLANNPSHNQDAVKAYNIQIEKVAGSSNFTINVFKFDHAFLGMQTSTTLPFNGEEVSLHILVKDDKVLIFIGDNRNSVLEFNIDKTFITDETNYVGLRSQVCSQLFTKFVLTSSEINVGTSHLESAISIASEFDLTEYTPATAETLRLAIAKAREILTSDVKNQKEVNEINTLLRDAIANLEKLGNPAKLKSLLSLCANLDLRCYTKDSYEELINLVETINKKDLDVLSEKEINELMTELINKMVKLEVMASDLALLNSFVAEAETLNKEDYTAESYAKLSTVLLKVKQLNTSASAQEIDAGCIELLQAIVDLVEKEVIVVEEADFETLNSLIASANGLNKEDYTAESYEEFKEVLDAVKLLNDKATQKEVDAACIRLLQAQLKLELVPEVDSNQPASCTGNVMTSIFALVVLAAIVIFIKRKKQYN